MDKSIKLIQNSKFKIQHLITPILFFLLLSCSSPTETPKGSLSGTVNLEGLSDHSNITVAIYDLAVLDPEIVSINQQYPHIGVIINQHTEFDHRLQEPVKYTETDAEGYFEIKKIPTGMYNIVAIKDSFGFKYIYEINIQEGENELSNSQFSILNSQLNSKFKIQNSKLVVRSSDITLFPETSYTNQVPTTTFLTDHHYIIDNPYGEVILYNNSLTIQPRAVVRITPNTDFKILGTLTAQGEENNMFWVTTNAGFSESLISNDPDSLAFYNSFELTSYASISNDLIEWGKWDFGNENLIINSYNNDLIVTNLIITNGNDNLTVSNVDSELYLSNLLISCAVNKCLQLTEVDNAICSNSIVMGGDYGIELKHQFFGIISNTYMCNNNYGIAIVSSAPIVEHNDFKDNSIDIRLVGRNAAFSDTMKIYKNILNSPRIVWHKNYTGSYGTLPPVTFEGNNIYCEEYFISYRSTILESEFMVNGNYIEGCLTISDVKDLCYDQLEIDLNNEMIVVENLSLTPLENAGIVETVN